MSPLQHSLGLTNGISPLLCFHFWEEVYYRHDDSDFPSETREGHGHFVGIAENVGHAMTYKILTSDTNKIICRSSVRPAAGSDPNLHALAGRDTVFKRKLATKRIASLRSISVRVYIVVYVRRY